MKFSRLFSPKSIAVIGGGVWGGNVVKHCRSLGFEGEIFPIHPKGDVIGGIESLKSIDDLPFAPDAAYICVNRHLTIEAVRKLNNMGCGGVVCLASGFQEASAEDHRSADLQAELLEAAGDMPLIGPNCYGFINYLDKMSLWPDQQGGIVRESGVAVLAQSSNIAMNLTMLQCGLPLSHVFAVGNQAQLDMAELALALIDDERVKAIGLHIEGIKNIRNFETLAQKSYEKGKPVIVLKVGKSQAAQAATVSHTASLAGNHQAAQAFFDRLGFASVETLPEMIETLKLAYITGKLTGNRISSMSCSGGEASLVADLAENKNLTFPYLSAQTSDALREALGPLVALANPLDYHTYIWRNEDKLAEVFTIMAKSDHDMNLVILDYPRTDRADDTDWSIVEKAVIRAREATGADFAIVSTMHNNMQETHAETLLAEGIVPFMGINEALIAIEKLSALTEPQSTPILLSTLPHSSHRYEEYEAKALLSQAGMAVPFAFFAQDAKEASQVMTKFQNTVVLKGQGFAHKTEAGAVKLNLNSPSAVYETAKAMNAQSYLVEEMITDVIAELIIGATYDPAHGMMLTIGAGGVLTEIIRDTTSLLLPTDAQSIETALLSLKIAPLLQGYRGQDFANMSKIVEAVLSLQDFIINHDGQIQEIEINPLLVGKDFAIAADALIIGDIAVETGELGA